MSTQTKPNFYPRFERSRENPCPSIGMRGYVKADVIDHTGKTIREGEWQKNLLLDAGLDQLSQVSFCDLFANCTKGTGNPNLTPLTIAGGLVCAAPTPTSETPATSNTYTLTVVTGGLTGTLTRAAGTRAFTDQDIGKLVRTVNIGTTTAQQVECEITGYTSATVVSVKGVGNNTLAAYTAKTIVLYSVNQIDLDNEIGRTNTYSSVSGDNSTVTGSGASTNGGAGVRTFTRTFIFGPETNITPSIRPDTYTCTGTALTSAAAEFTTADIGSYVFLNDVKTTITAFVSATHVTVSANVPGGPFVETGDGTQCSIFAPTIYTEIGFSDQSVSPGYSPLTGSSSAGVTWTGTTFTLTGSPVGSFSPNSVGQYIAVVPTIGSTSTGQPYIYAMITGYTSATQVTVNRPAPSELNTGTAITAYLLTDNPQNIRIALATPVVVYGPNLTDPSQQLKVTYKFIINVGPTTLTTLSNPVSGWASSGNCVIEEFATSTVNTDGTSNNSNALIDPYASGYMGLSTATAALHNMSANAAVPNRGAGVQANAATAGNYTPGTFSNTYAAVFAATDAVNMSVRSLMFFDTNSGQGVFTYLLNAAVLKDSVHSMTVVLVKSWNRNLS